MKPAPAARPNSPGVIPANDIGLSKRKYDVRTDSGTRFIFEVSQEQARRGIAEGIFALVRSSRGDYLERRTAPDNELGRFAAPSTTERPRDNGRYIASDTLLQHRGEQPGGRVRSPYREPRGEQKGFLPELFTVPAQRGVQFGAPLIPPTIKK